MNQAIHLKSGKVATIISENHEMKIGDKWHPAVLFTCEGTDKTFSRTVLQFNMKFRRVNKQPGRRQDGFQSPVSLGRSNTPRELPQSRTADCNAPYEG